MTTRDGLIGIAVAIVIGAIVRFLKLPIPAPPTIYGALMVLGTTVGYLVADHFLRK